MSSPILSVKNLTMNFGGSRQWMIFPSIYPTGSICSLIGPNGAGKTTCFNCVTGFYKPDTGSISFEWQNIADSLPQDRETGHRPELIRISAPIPTSPFLKISWLVSISR